MKKEMMYVAPELEVLKVAVENGFEASGTIIAPGMGGDGNE